MLISASFWQGAFPVLCVVTCNVVHWFFSRSVSLNKNVPFHNSSFFYENGTDKFDFLFHYCIVLKDLFSPLRISLQILLELEGYWHVTFEPHQQCLLVDVWRDKIVFQLNFEPIMVKEQVIHTMSQWYDINAISDGLRTIPLFMKFKAISLFHRYFESLWRKTYHKKLPSTSYWIFNKRGVFIAWNI